jgi:hypothetical protein
MKKYLLVLVLLIVSVNLTAQTEYSGKSLGWIKLGTLDVPQKPLTWDHRVYSAKQMQISQMLAVWAQQSYTPKGGIGQALKLVNEKLGLYNDYTKAQPQYYGANAKTFIDLRRNAEGQWRPVSNTNWFMNIAVNGVIGDRSYAITSPEKWFFYIPGEAGLSETQREVAKLGGFPSNPTLKKYISWYQPKGIATTLQFVVLLCKDNVKPYVQLTKGEYLSELGNAIERDAAEKKKQGSDVSSLLSQRRAALARLNAKYKNRLNEPAKLKQQPGIRIEDADGFDVFESRNYPAEYPVYKFDPAKLALTKTDQPQWIVISWDAEGVANGDEAGTHLHQTMLNKINYDYIYNYFFYPEKVRGISYKPLR